MWYTTSSWAVDPGFSTRTRRSPFCSGSMARTSGMCLLGLYLPNAAETFSTTIAGGTLMLTRSLLDEVGGWPAGPRRVDRLLIDAVEKHCRDAGCDVLDIEVVNLRLELPAFYTKFGFAPAGTAIFPDTEKLTRDAHLMLMSKPL